MITPPSWLTKAPMFIYWIAALTFAATFALEYFELWLRYRYSGAEDPQLAGYRLRILYNAFRESIYIGLSGPPLQVLLGIWQQLSEKPFSITSQSDSDE